MGEILYLALPLGTAHSWGVCGRYVTRELARMAPVCLVTDRLEAGLVGDELELAALRGLLAPPEIQAGRAADVTRRAAAAHQRDGESVAGSAPGHRRGGAAGLCIAAAIARDR